jgi:serine/threonine protein kinase
MNSFEQFSREQEEIFNQINSKKKPDQTDENIRLINSVPSEIAIKVYSKEKMKSSVRRRIIQNEFEVLSKIDNFRIIKFYQRIETNKQIHFLMEYFKGQGLDCFLKRFLQKRIPQKMGKPILRQILEGLEYLHENNIYHRGNNNKTSNSKMS